MDGYIVIVRYVFCVLCIAERKWLAKNKFSNAAIYMLCSTANDFFDNHKHSLTLSVIFYVLRFRSYNDNSQRQCQYWVNVYVRFNLYLNRSYHTARHLHSYSHLTLTDTRTTNTHWKLPMFIGFIRGNILNTTLTFKLSATKHIIDWNFRS